MSVTELRKFAFVLTIIPYVAFGTGCNQSTDVELKKEPLVQIPEPKAPKDQPKHLRPSSGSSAGMNRDPSGMTPPP
jgi:hypothetical protein